MKPTNQIGTADFFNQPLPKDRRPVNRPKNKGKDFGTMLRSAPNNPRKDHARKADDRLVNSSQQQTNNNRIREKIETKPQQLNQKPTIRKPSRALRSWGHRLAKQEGGLQRFPALSFLEGKSNSQVGNQLPQLLSQENSFLAQAIGSDLKVLMHSQFKLGDLVDMLGLSEPFMAEAEKHGLDPNEVVSPKHFFQSLGIDPHKVIAEIDRLKIQLSKNGLGSYLNQHPNATHKQQTTSRKGIKSTESSFDSVPNPKQIPLYPIKKLSQTPELEHLWQAPTEPQKSIQKSPGGEVNPFTRLEKKQLQSLQAKHTPMQSLHPLEHQQIGTQRHSALQQQAPSLLNQQYLRTGKNQSEAQTVKQIPIQNGFLEAGQSRKQASPKPDFNPSTIAGAQSSTKPNIADIIKNLNSDKSKKSPIGLPKNSVSNDLSHLFKGKNIINKPLQTDPKLNTFETLGKVDQLEPHIVLQQQTSNIQKEQEYGSDLGLDLGKVAVGYKQSMPKDSFETIQRQLKNPFTSSPNAEANSSDEEMLQLDLEKNPELTIAGTNALHRPKQQTNTKIKLAKHNAIKEIRPNRFDLSTQIEPLKQEEPIQAKSKINLQNLEAPEIDLPKPNTQNSPSIVQESAFDLSPELTFEARQEMLDKIAEQSLNLNRQGGGRANIVISDKNFGELSLAVQVEGNEVQLKMNSQSDQIRNLLGQDINNLKDTLSGQNLNLVQVDVSNNEYGHDSNHQNNNFQFLEQQRQNQFSGSPEHGESSKANQRGQGDILNINKTTENFPNMSHNLLSKHIQVAA
ncbi:MAG: flagellar hook-length control protein FliK [Oligoflexales bacterium]